MFIPLSKATLVLLIGMSIGHQALAQSTTRFIPPDAAVAAKCDAPTLMKHPALSDIPWPSLNGLCQAAMGFPLDNVETAIVFAAPPGPDGLPMIGAVIELREALPIEKLLPRIQQLNALKLETLPDASGKYLVGPAIDSATWEVRAVNETTFLIGLTPTVAAMQKQATEPVDGELTRLLGTHEPSAFQACLVMNPLRRIAQPVLSDPRLVKLVPGIYQLPEQLASASFQLDLSGTEPEWTLAFEAANPIVAEQLEQFVTRNWKQGLAALAATPDSTLGQFAAAFSQVEPQREGAIVQFTTIGTEGVDRQMYVRGLTELFLGGSRIGSSETRRIAATQDLMQLMLAVHNYADKHEHSEIVPQTTKSSDGKPLLSWRVQLLPYLGQQELYDQFHHDEPWDSPHNLTLVAKMPEVYTIPGDEDLATQGKTRYLRPVGEGMPGGSDTLLHFRDFTDGTSNTIGIVETSRENATVWTQPADLAVDINHPREALFPGDSPGFNAALYDGSGQFHPNTSSDKRLKALLTHQGGEVAPEQ